MTKNIGGAILLKLKGYVYALCISLLVLFAVNASLSLSGVCSFGVWYAFYIMILGTVVLFLIDTIVALVVQRLPQKWINPYFWGYKIFRFERKVYEFFGIRRWKDKIPEMGGALKKFSKSHLQNHTPQYVYHFITETIYGEMSHTYSIIAGAFIFLILPHYILNFALPLFLINFVLNLLPAMVQRYTRPKLIKMYQRMLDQTQKMLYNEEQQEQIVS